MKEINTLYLHCNIFSLKYTFPFFKPVEKLDIIAEASDILPRLSETD